MFIPDSGMNSNQQPGQNAAQYNQQYAGYMPPGQTAFYNPAAAYPAAYPGVYAGFAGTMDAQYLGYYGMTGAMPTATPVPTAQAGSATNTQVKCFFEIYDFN